MFTGLSRGINSTCLGFLQLEQKHVRFYTEVYFGVLASKLLDSIVVEAIHLVQYQASSESEITYHASAVVGHILYYLMEYCLLSCRNIETGELHVKHQEI